MGELLASTDSACAADNKKRGQVSDKHRQYMLESKWNRTFQRHFSIEIIHRLIRYLFFSHTFFSPDVNFFSCLCMYSRNFPLSHLNSFTIAIDRFTY